jgi:hypothetical protein
VIGATKSSQWMLNRVGERSGPTIQNKSTARMTKMLTATGTSRLRTRLVWRDRSNANGIEK